MHNNSLYQLGKEWVTIDRFRKARGIEPEKEVIEIKKEKIKIVEPELKTKKK